MTLLYNLIIFPIYYFIDYIFKYFNVITGSILWSIFIVSFLVNIISLPMYMQAEKLQNEELEKKKILKPQIDLIKENFKGDEKFMLLQTCYRQNHYHPIMALRSSLSLLIQIPFFTAAYIFFNNLELLKNIPLLFDKTLGMPDGLLNIFGISINILPIIMTVINIISAEIYAKDKPVKNRIQMWSFAIIFLVLLYNSPAGLVIYWTFNNIFSLIKNIGLRSENPLLFLKKTCITITFILMYKVILSNLEYSNNINLTGEAALFIMFAIIFVVSSLFTTNIKKVLTNFSKLFTVSFNKFIFLAIIITTVIGLLIPSMIISSSNDIITVYNNLHPLVLIIDNLSKIAGLYVFWPIILYYFTDKKYRYIYHLIATLIIFVNVLMFCSYNSELGIISIDFSFTPLHFTGIELIFDMLVIIFLFLIIVPLVIKREKLLNNLLFLVFIISLGFSMYNIVKLHNGYRINQINKSTHPRKSNNSPLKLSKNGKNVLILFVDRAIGVYAKEIFENDEKLKNNYSGFVLYPNTVSFYSQTVIAYLPMIGGYEYVPFNNITHENLEEKTNQTYLMLPKIFMNNGFQSTIINPHSFYDEGDYDYKGSLDTYKGSNINLYSYNIGDFNIEFNQHEAEVMQIFKENIASINDLKKNIFILSNYLAMSKILKTCSISNRETNKNNVWDKRIINNYIQLVSLKNLTSIDNSNNNYFTIFNNELTHINKYDKSYGDEAFWLEKEGLYSISEYINFLKQNDVYDNTRIIIVADHGWNYHDSKYLAKGALRYNPLLMFKDFNNVDNFKEDMSFMTNADTPILAVQDIISKPINPYTGKNINDCINKNTVKILSGYSGSGTNARATLRPDKGSYHTVHDNIFDNKNWEYAN